MILVRLAAWVGLWLGVVWLIPAIAHRYAWTPPAPEFLAFAWTFTIAVLFIAMETDG